MAKSHSTSNDTDATFVLLILAPLSELYGRMPVYNTCNVIFVICTILCALSQSMDMLMAFRLYSGFPGVATITYSGGAMALYALGPLSGPMSDQLRESS